MKLTITRALTAMFLAGSTLLLTACPSEGGDNADAGDALLTTLLLRGGAGTPGGGLNPGAPIGSPFSVTAVPGNGSVNLNWSYSGSATSFVVYFSTTGSVNIASTSVVSNGAQRSFTHTGLTNGTSYTYRIAAANAAGTGSLSSSSATVVPDSWAAATSGTTNRMRSVRYLNNEFWAVGDNRTILRSSDGITWSSVNPGCGGASVTLHDIAHDGGNKFRIGGSSGLLIKSDNNATSWTCVTIAANQTYEGVHYASGLWLLTGTDTGSTAMLIGLSTDGDAFGVAGSTGSFFSDAFRDIAYYSSSGTYVVTGRDGVFGRCSTSCSSGANWSFGRITSNGFGVWFNGSYFRNNRYNFVSSSRIYTLDASFSGLQSHSDDDADANRIVDRGTEILTAGDDGKIYSSADGLDFTRRGQAATTNDLNGLACSPSRCVAVGDSGTVIYR